MNTKCRASCAALPILALLAVGGGGSSARAEEKKPVVGLVMKSLANEFFKSMEEGARKFAAEDGTFTLVPVGMNSETDIDTQISAMENFITQKVDLICVAPADSVGLVAPVKKAIKAGITVVNFDVKLDDKALAKAGLKDLVFVGPTTGKEPIWRATSWRRSWARAARYSSSRATPAPTTPRCARRGSRRRPRRAGSRCWSRAPRTGRPRRPTRS